MGDLIKERRYLTMASSPPQIQKWMDEAVDEIKRQAKRIEELEGIATTVAAFD